jgi:hypothetical protein
MDRSRGSPALSPCEIRGCLSDRQMLPRVSLALNPGYGPAPVNDPKPIFATKFANVTSPSVM